MHQGKSLGKMTDILFYSRRDIFRERENDDKMMMTREFVQSNSSIVFKYLTFLVGAFGDKREPQNRYMLL